MKLWHAAPCISILWLTLAGPVAAFDDVADFVKLRDAYEAKFKPLFIESSLAWWEANTTGKDAAFERKKNAEAAVIELQSDPERFKQLKQLQANKRIIDPLLARQLDVMIRACLPAQADKALQKKIIDLQNQIEQTFNTHRSRVGDRELTENDVRKTLAEGKDSSAAEKAWKGYMAVGAKVEADLKKLVAWRNEVARSQGYKNFYAMRLALDEIGEDQLLALFDELDTLTRAPFNEIKKQIDAEQAKRFGVAVADLRPWHFGDLFFQEAPESPDAGLNLDEVYKSQDLLALAQAYYSGIAMPIGDIVARSDLYEKPGKSPHAFCTSIDRVNDIRVLCNMKQNLFWADTSLHEIGHAVYEKYIDPGVPFLLHEPAHSLTTEGYAMMMGAMAKNEEYLAKIVKLPAQDAARAAQAARQHLRREKLIFSRWAQVMVRFEHGMYSNPEQDLGKLWWNLKQNYQSLPSPGDDSRPDYGAKVHIVTNPAYYHSYMMGDLFACQLHDAIARRVLGKDDPTKCSFANEPKVGAYLKSEVFGPGNLYSWNDLTMRATGSRLSAKYFAAQYVKN